MDDEMCVGAWLDDNTNITNIVENIDCVWYEDDKKVIIS